MEWSFVCSRLKFYVLDMSYRSLSSTKDDRAAFISVSATTWSPSGMAGFIRFD